MPRQRVDTLYVSRDTCYTILDPGGTGNYMYNEDSWLIIVSRDGRSRFSLQGDYDLGAAYRGDDYLDIYYDTTATSSYQRYSGEGTVSFSERTRTKLHLHTNNYAAFPGFVLQIRFNNTLNSYSETIVNDSTVQLSWNDTNSRATAWTVSYWNNIGDTLLATTSTTSITLTGLEHNTYYQYIVENDVSPCMTKVVRTIKMPCDSGVILLSPVVSETDTIEVGRCYHIYDAAGSKEGTLSSASTTKTIRTREGNNFYLRSMDTLSAIGSLYFRMQTPTSTRSVSLTNSQRNGFCFYFPKGTAGITNSGIQQCHLEVLQENSCVVKPTVNNITATTATVVWSDSSASTAWTFRYGCGEGAEQVLSLTAPTVTLTGLQPGRQYVYSIEGNDTAFSCMVPARHGFITTTSSDTIIMPYRGVDTLTINPTMCYTILDPGGTDNYFHTDWSTLVVRSVDGRGFRFTGQYNMGSGESLTIQDGTAVQTYSGTNSFFEHVCTSGILTVTFVSDISINKDGFEFHIGVYPSSVYNIQATGITTSSATLTWSDTSAGASQWTVQYGPDEESMQTVVAVAPSLTLANLQPGTQYVYSVKNDAATTSCMAVPRQAFVTDGLPAGVALMPYRGTDTLWITDTCFTIYDAGGEHHDYFNHDTSYLVLLSPTGDEFNVTVEFVYDGQDNHDFVENSYDSKDVLTLFTSPTSSYGNSYNGSCTRWSTSSSLQPRRQSSNGYMKLRFVSNSRSYRNGFRLTVDHDNAPVSNVTFHRVTSTEATVRWSDNSHTAWTVWYGPHNGPMQMVTATTREVQLTGLTPGTDYDIRITGSTSASPCAVRAWTFSTLDANSIVMGFHRIDTVTIQPYDCYMVYDPGGTGNYLDSDSSLLLIKTPNGEPFRLYGDCYVGSNTDRNDKVVFSSDTARRYWWGGSYRSPSVDILCEDGVALISLVTNEAFNRSGFCLRVQYYPTISNVDTALLSDTSVTILWADISNATEWTVTYGPSEDSMTSTVTTTFPNATLTGLRRNQQYYYHIKNNAFSYTCVMPSIYGVIMPHDEDMIIMPYINTLLERVRLQDLYNTNRVVALPGRCYTVYDDGVNNNMFSGQGKSYTIFSADGRGITLEGNYYYAGDGSLTLSNNRNTFSYSGFGSVKFYSNTGSISLGHKTNAGGICQSPGYNLRLFMNYPVFNIRTDSLSCTSATLLWDDTSSATQWTIAYGPAERQLDTVTVTQKRLDLLGLEPDHQYICYFYSNDTTGGDCMRPVKYAFITTCDTSIIILPYNSYGDTHFLDIKECYTVLDPGAPNDYFYQDNISYYLWSTSGAEFSLRGTYKLGESDNLTIRDASGISLFSAGGNSEGTVNVLSRGNRARIVFESGTDTSISAGFSFDVRFLAITNIRTDLMTDTTCRVWWDDYSTGTEWTFWYGRDKENLISIQTTEKRVHLQDLEPGVMYHVFITNNAVDCIDTTWFEFCAGGDNCIQFADLYSCHTTAHYGRFDEPDAYIGVVDYGWDSIFSRHTVIDDTSARDPRTNNLLRCVPPGHLESVRLGNWYIGGEAEQIQYDYIVDTTSADLLILNYAAVLEQPGHNDYDQPRFRFSILDDQYREINPTCYSADFIASDSLGWNRNDSILWKDWTAVGVDLTPLHGRHVIVQLTTYDCNQMGHYGYAYFAMSCDHKRLVTGMCGEVSSNTFTAPAGFNYEWYNVDSSHVILGTSQTFTASENGEYRCRASFAGNENASNCYFEKVGIVGNIVPHANFIYEVIDTVDCNVTVQFYNRSKVLLMDSNAVQETRQDCESFVWDFGDGEISYDVHPTHIFPAGHFNVSLTAAIAGEQCEDDTVVTILMPSPCISYDTVIDTLCHGDTLWVRDSAFTETGNYVLRREYRSDSIWETFIYLWVHPSYDTIIYGGICDGEEYDGYGFHVTDSGTYHSAYHTVAGCDSLFTLHVSLAHATSTELEEWICGNESYTFGDTALHVPGLYIDSLLTWRSCDSIVSLNLTVYPYFDTTFEVAICQGDTHEWGIHSYMETGIYVDSLTTAESCDSVLRLNLTVNPVYHDTIYQQFCQNTTAEFNHNVYSLPGVYQYVYTTIETCDSLQTFILSYYDSTFASHFLWSTDEETWQPSDSLIIGCSPLTVYLRDSSVGNSQQLWYFDDGTTSREDNVLQEYSQPGIYSFYFIAVNPDGCKDTLTFDSIVIYPYSDTTIEAAICQGEVYEWGYQSYAETDIYVDSLTTSHGCDSICRLNLTVNPVYDDTIYQEFCQNTTVEFNHDVYSLPGEYVYNYTTIDACDSIQTFVLSYYDSTFASAFRWSLDEETWFPSDSLIIGCTPMTVYLRDSSSGNNATLWYFEEDGSAMREKEVQHEYLRPGMYTIALIVTNPEGCEDTLVRDSVMVYESPRAYYVYEPAHPSRLHPEVVFSNRSTPAEEIVKYEWRFYSDREDTYRYDSSMAVHPSYTWPGIGTEQSWPYVATLTAWRYYRNPYGDTTACSNTFADTIVMLNEQLFFPNVVTANGDGVNDRMVIVNLLGNDYYSTSHLWVYNRWGTKVFERENFERESDFWDPNASNCPDGTYYYRFVATGLYGRIERNGVVEVLR